ncbi:MAG: hypothetical protein JWM33_1486 [Caulobacteraceae bacterium]|nr:hypothetical protein [Caulobacteraceae bacterium]
MYRRMTGIGLVAALMLAGCGKAPATAQIDGSTQVATAAKAAAVPLVDGKPMWSANKTYSAQENASRAFASNGAVFGAADVNAYVKLAHAFVDHPPTGAKTLTRANGDTLIYDAPTNTFAVRTSDGVPRTLFKPSTGAAYWDQQVASGGDTRSTAAAKTPAKSGGAA